MSSQVLRNICYRFYFFSNYWSVFSAVLVVVVSASVVVGVVVSRVVVVGVVVSRVVVVGVVVSRVVVVVVSYARKKTTSYRKESNLQNAQDPNLV
ncbi:Hypothetical predicted protein [Octopus vulgaris]|uniref:Transmembrane protein n=1 Tax=Octopus vulgaris TaxID=6645 RepID=A0AA36ANR2_OCTVU|nr:Hypothetical predicted protein [Octopus vulgaris]